ncbi:NTP transferase domain-containing protein [Paludisphaera mucosa]|uniref:NTP transferase domain-containing protein n=1 Tax=Paludisphaera mucosa TaxID=3030827 RepID=A0ABT6F5P3_9BACT|nr:NTP transferase domain-containing protein [Paludisphaera mucosa]MDG3002895.1 NTP transferase domain-containing protein [Paludisphaera mucosa]
MSPTGIPAIVPAAGASRRMGRPKLLIAFDGRPLISRVVTSLLEGGAGPVIVVSPPADTPEGPPIIDAATAAGAVVVIPEARPAAMRDSIELAVAELKRSEAPPGVLLMPADSPRLDALVVETLIDAWGRRPDRIVAPTFRGRRGHPILLPWRLVELIADLPADVGVNALIAEHSGLVDEVAFETDAVVVDLDTPEDLRRLETAGAGRKVRLFAIARERARGSEVVVALAEPATVRDLRIALAAQYPALAEIVDRVRIAVDDEYADDATIIPADATLALIPPVSGGGR